MFFAIDDERINAFALPGGYIGVHTGLLEASRNEDELAGVMARFSVKCTPVSSSALSSSKSFHFSVWSGQAG